MNHLGRNNTVAPNAAASAIVAGGENLMDLAMQSYAVQRTLSRPANCMGIALHSGKKISLTLKPAPAGSGIQFRRTDLAGSAPIAANWENVVDTTLCTTLGAGDHVRIATVEHLMAALAGCHVDNVLVELDGPEVPVMDGSAHPFVFLIECAGVIEQDASRPVLEILKTIKVAAGDSYAELTPAQMENVSYPVIWGEQVVSRTRDASSARWAWTVSHR